MPQSSILAPAEAAAILGVSVVWLKRRLDAELDPMRTPTGRRVYLLERVLAVKAARDARASATPKRGQP